jgi:DNA-directed RNA polymerase specialized sigma24 family protein
MNKLATRASYHQIAKAAISHSFDDDDEYITLVKQTAGAYEKLDDNGKLAVEAAYIFSRKVPSVERQDFYQEIICAVLESATTKAEFAYTIARRDWQDWWRSFKLHSQFHEGYLSEALTNSDGEETELAELLVGEVEFEAKQIDKLDARRLWQQIPTDIQRLVVKRLRGRPLGSPRKRKAGRPASTGSLDNTERQRLNRWVKANSHLLVN